MAQSINGDGNAAGFGEIHSASDGKLIRYPITTRFMLGDKHKIIDCLLEVVRTRANPQIRDFGIRGLAIIKQDCGAPPNYQSRDRFFADDILCEICDIISSLDDSEVIDTAINHICEQFADMIRTSGTCPSGRVNRLMNVYMFLRDYKDGIHLPPSLRPH